MQNSFNKFILKSDDSFIEMKQIVLFFTGIMLLSSCVTNKKYVYLQKDDVNRDVEVKDSVVREYITENFDYRIQSNDLISVHFNSLTPEEYDFFSSQQPSSNMNLSGGASLLFGELVDPNGEISFPVVGKVKVTGLTIFEIQDKLQALANKYLETPVVKVRLLNYRVTLLGEVNNEGTYTMTNNSVNIIQAIGLAGGLTDLADKSNIKLIRQREGKTEVLYIDLLDEKFLTSPYYYVYQNDVLIVPALRQRPFRRYFGPNMAMIISSASLFLLIYNLSRN